MIDLKTKIINILGSTGSIGTQTLEICKERNIKVNGISANNNIDLLEKQAREFNVKFCHINNSELLSKLKYRTFFTMYLIISSLLSNSFTNDFTRDSTNSDFVL